MACRPCPVARNLHTTAKRFLAWLDFLFVDHGIFRVIYNNFHALPGGLYRCSQPSPGQIRRYHRKYGIKSIVNLRGADHSRRYALQEEICRELGIELINFRGIMSREMPSAETLQRTQALFDNLEYPALIHCKSGADRAGLAAVLYRHLKLGEPMERALPELSWKSGHIRAAQTGMLDVMLDTYVARNAKSPISLLEWAATEYDRLALEAKFKTRGWANFVVDRILGRE